MSSTLFIVALNMAPEGTAEKENIVYISKQICAYADDIVLVTRNIQKGRGTSYSLYWKLEAEKWAMN
jgi:hypothetical protein